jgi:hypothetical protein
MATLRQHVGDGEIIAIDPQIEVWRGPRIAVGPFQGIEAIVLQLLSAKE